MDQLLVRLAEREQRLPGKKSPSFLTFSSQGLRHSAAGSPFGRDVQIPCAFLYSMSHLSASEEEGCCTYRPRSSAGHEC